MFVYQNSPINTIESEANLYNKMRTLPDRLKYDYQRRVIARELSNEAGYDKLSLKRQLPSASGKSAKQSFESVKLLDSSVITNAETSNVVSNKVVSTVLDINASEIDLEVSENFDSSDVIESFYEQNDSENDIRDFLFDNINELNQMKEELTWIARDIIAVDLMDAFTEVSSRNKGETMSDTRNDVEFQLSQSKERMKLLAVASEACENLIDSLTAGDFNNNVVVRKADEMNLYNGLKIITGISSRLLDRSMSKKKVYIFISELYNIMDSKGYEAYSTVDSSPVSYVEEAIDSSNNLIVQEQNDLNDHVDVPTESLVIDTSAETNEPAEKQIRNIIFTGLDVSLFLIENVISNVASVIKERGSIAIQRFAQTYCIDENFALVNQQIEKYDVILLSKKDKARVNGSWRLLGQLK